MPDLLDPRVLLPAVAIAAAAGVLKGSIGFGFPLVAVPLLALVVGTRTAIILLSVPILATNSLLLVRRPVERDIVRRFVPMILPMLPAVLVGGMVLTWVDSRLISLAVGVSSLLFAVLSLARVRLVVTPRVERLVSPAVGAAAGLMYGATSILGPIFALYLDGLRLEKRAFVYGLTLLFAVGNIAQVASYVTLGLYGDGLWLGSLLLVPAALLAQQAGFAVQDRLDPVRFRQVVVVVVGLSSVNLIASGLGLY